MAGCAESIAKSVLILVNIIFVLLGLGLAVAGLVFKFNNDVFDDDLRDVLEEIHLDTVGGTDVYSLIQSLSNLFIGIGFVIFAIGFLGCCGACCQWKWMLVVYAVIVIILMVVQIVAVALFASFQGEVDRSFSDTAVKALKDHYNSTDEVSKSFNKLFQMFDCCGIVDYRDFNFSTDYPRLPDACCVSVVNVTSSCTTKNSFTNGCFTELYDSFTAYEPVFIGISVGIIIFQAICVIFAFCLCRTIDKEEATAEQCQQEEAK